MTAAQESDVQGCHDLAAEAARTSATAAREPHAGTDATSLDDSTDRWFSPPMSLRSCLMTKLWPRLW